MNALTATADNIVDGFHGNGEVCEGVEEEVRSVKRRWEALKSELHAQSEKQGEINDQFSEFLTGFTGFCNWLSEIRGQLLDELCVAIPHKASGDTIATHKARLKVREGGRGGRVGLCKILAYSTYTHDLSFI